MKVFVDTSAWLALEIENDKYHDVAKKYVGSLIDQRAMLFTNDYILSETYTRLIYDFHLSAAWNFQQKINEGTKKNLSLLEVDELERTQTWKELHKYADHKLSFADGTVVVHFQMLNLDYIFTFDRHFRDINLPTNL